MYAGSTRTKWYLVRVDMDQSDPVSMSKYRVYPYIWHIIKYKDCNKYPTTECRFCTEIRMENNDGTLGKRLPVRPSKVNKLLQKNQKYVWCQDDIYLDEHRVVGPFQFGTTGRKKSKYPNMIDEKQWKELDKEGQNN